jgi:hypothetical protein
MPATVDRSTWKSGQFNAWVVLGETREIRKERLDQVPDEYRAGVENHVITYFKIKAANNRRNK